MTMAIKTIDWLQRRWTVVKCCIEKITVTQYKIGHWWKQVTIGDIDWEIQRIIIFTSTFLFVEKLTVSGLITPVRAPLLPSNGHYYQPLSPLSECETDPMKKSKKIPLQLSPEKCCSRGDTYATSFCRQLTLLLMRTFLVLWRDRSLTAMRLFIHVVTALLIGTLYFGIGDDATMIFNIHRYIFFSIMFLMFVGKRKLCSFLWLSFNSFVSSNVSFHSIQLRYISLWVQIFEFYYFKILESCCCCIWNQKTKILLPIRSTKWFTNVALAA